MQSLLSKETKVNKESIFRNLAPLVSFSELKSLADVLFLISTLFLTLNPSVRKEE